MAKNMRYLHYTSIFAFFVLLLASCSDSDQSEIVTPELREVSFSVANEFIGQSFEPMSRTESGAKYYGMNIYKDGKPYAYGVFDELAKMRVILEADAEYDFECTSLLEDHHKVAKIHYKTAGDVFMYPFCVGTEEKGYPISELNHFIYSDKENLYCIGDGKTTVVDGDAMDSEGFATKTKDEFYPSQYRWYGDLNKFTLTSDDVVNINLKSASFAVKLLTDNVPDGSVTWYSTYYDFCNPVIDANNLEVTTVFSFAEIKNPLPSKLSLNIVWTRESGSHNPASTVDIEIEPQKITSLTLNFEG